MPAVIDDFLPADAYRELREYVQSQPMRYGAKSNSQTDPHGHWSWKPIHDNQKNLADLTLTLPPLLLRTFNRVKLHAALGQDPVVIRCYANGYTYGTDGYFHTDSDRHDEKTVILFMCEKWDPDWAGETVYGKPEDGAVLPYPNRALIIESNQPHAARAVSRKCTALRTTLMFKTRPRRSEGFERLSEWLVAKGALKFKHAKGTLHDHLCRVFQLLYDRGHGGIDVFYAGGLHSIYGTNAYQSQLIVPTPITRGEVADRFGKEAESLAYLFSCVDRPGTLESPAWSSPEESHLLMRHDQKMSVSKDQLRNLRLIECANLADQDSLTPEKWPVLHSIWKLQGIWNQKGTS